MDALLTAVRNEPLSYLPEVSLSLLSRFRRGYDLRCRLAGRPHDWGFDFVRFAIWVQQQFGIAKPEIECAENVILSFVIDEREAFQKYFELADIFSSFGHDRQSFSTEELEAVSLHRYMAEHPARCVGFSLPMSPDSKRSLPPAEETGLVGIIKAIRERPAFYLGFPTFRGCCAFLIGDERAQEDLELPSNEGRVIFAEFKNWIEIERNRALPRPWFQAISFTGSLSDDCGHARNGALSHFYDLLDRYAQTISRPGLFRVPMDWRDWQQTNRSS